MVAPSQANLSYLYYILIIQHRDAATNCTNCTVVCEGIVYRATMFTVIRVQYEVSVAKASISCYTWTNFKLVVLAVHCK